MNDPILRLVHACALAAVPSILWSEPGAGKTARVLSYGRATKRHVERALLSRCEPIDIKPRIYDGGKVVVAKMPEIERLEEEEGGILFLDEFNRATREVEGAALDLVDSPPAGVTVIAACNPPSRGQAARSLEAAAANRFCHIDVGVNAEAWANATVSGWDSDVAVYPVPSKAAMDAARGKARALVSSFIRRTPSALEQPPKDPASAGRAWASTRTWDYACRLYAVVLAVGTRTAEEEQTNRGVGKFGAGEVIQLVGGCVGAGGAIELMKYVAEVDLPDPEALLADPKSYVPREGRVDLTIAAVSAVADAVERNLTDARWKAGWTLMGACVDADQSDAAMVGADFLMKSYRKLGVEALKKLTAPGKVMHPRIGRIVEQGDV